MENVKHAQLTKFTTNHWEDVEIVKVDQ
jgi:hypothetical protein